MKKLILSLAVALCFWSIPAFSQTIYTANYSNSTVSKITSGGSVTDPWATLASGTGPRGIAISTASASVSPFISTPPVIP